MRAVVVPVNLEDILDIFCDDYEDATKIEKVIYNAPATIIMFSDGTKSVVKCCDGDIYNKYAGFSLAYLKRMLGTKEYRKLLKEWVKDE